MADAQDILGGYIKKTPPRERKTLVRTPKKKKCPEGVNREVFELQRDNESEFAVSLGTVVEPKPTLPFRTKRAIFGKKAEKWVKRPFTNPARSDSLQLSHWDLESNQADREYYFTKFNKSADVCTYTDEEYEKYFKSPNWTKEETDTLIEFCQRFDLRFIIIADRFKEISPDKTIEDIKDRYYAIARQKLSLKNDKKALSEHIFRYKYNIEHEKKRKEQTEKLYLRSQDSVNEEKKLQNEFKRIETAAKKTQHDRKRVLQLIDSSITPLETPNKKRVKRIDLLAEAEENAITSPTVPRSNRRDRKNGAYARSTKVNVQFPISNVMQKKLDEALEEFSIPKNPVPNEQVVKEYNELRQDIVALMELQTFLKRREYELAIYSHQLELVKNNRQKTGQL